MLTSVYVVKKIMSKLSNYICGIVGGGKNIFCHEVATVILASLNMLLQILETIVGWV